MKQTSLQKLTDERLVERAKTGDEPARDELLRRHAGLVRSCARRYFLLGGETEDLLQEGMIGLYKAIGSYAPQGEGGKSFKNFAYLCVSRRIYDAVKSVYAQKRGSFFERPLDSRMEQAGLNPEELLILEDEQREFRQKMSKALSDFEFKVTTLYMDGMSGGEICEYTGKPLKSVDNALQRSKRKLLQLLKK